MQFALLCAVVPMFPLTTTMPNRESLHFPDRGNKANKNVQRQKTTKVWPELQSPLRPKSKPLTAAGQDGAPTLQEPTLPASLLPALQHFSTNLHCSPVSPQPLGLALPFVSIVYLYSPQGRNVLCSTWCTASVT